VQYLSIRYTDRLAEVGATGSVGSVGDSYDNAAAESLIGLYKTELIRSRGPWRGIDHVELATWNGSTGSTPADCTAPAATSHQRSTNNGTTVRTPTSKPSRRHNRASTEPGAVQTASG
jgi:transposase InsO family protein